MAVVAPIRGMPEILGRASSRAPSRIVEAGIPVVRPRLPPVPLGGLYVESRLWGTELAAVLRDVDDEIGCNLVHAHFALPDGFAGARYATRRGLPFVLTIWGSDVMIFGSKRRLAGTFARTFDSAHAIIAVSEELAERAAVLGAARDRLWVIPGGVPYGPIVPRAEARARLGVPESVVCLVWVGGLVPVKQARHAIDAFEQFVAIRRTDAMLVIIGAGPEQQGLREVVREKNLEGAVRLVGACSRHDVWTWQCAADLLLNSSLSEGTPLAVLEALGAGTPVAGYDVGGVRGAVEAVKGGRIAAANTPGALAAAVSAELDVERDRAVIASQARARFGIARTGEAIEAVYKAVK